MKFERKAHQAEKATSHPLRACRRDLGMTQEDLSKILGNTRAHISQIEHYRITPGIDLTLRMSILFGIPLEDWFQPKEIEKIKADVRKRSSEAGFPNTRKAHGKGQASAR